jgi:hypothetical protein
VHNPGAAALAHADRLLQPAQQAGLAVKRLSLRRTAPNFQVHVSLPDDRQQPAHGFFEAVHAVAERALD